jgi:hypothetical protein
MKQLYAQGDLLIERVPDIPVPGVAARSDERSPLVLAEGETTGHRHAIYDRAVMFRDDGLASDVPDGLYIGHVRVEDACARVTHEEHAPVTLPKGTYRVRRQRELDLWDPSVIAD